MDVGMNMFYILTGIRMAHLDSDSPYYLRHTLFEFVIANLILYSGKYATSVEACHAK